MFNWRSLHCYYINLSHRPDRDVNMIKELNRVGLKARRFEAIRTVDESWNREPYKVMFKRSKGAIGCMISQMSVMAEAYRNGVGAMVLEDDLVMATDLLERLDYIENFINEKEPEFDIVFLGGTVHVNPPWWHKKGHDPMLQMCKCKLERDADRTSDERMLRVYGMFSTHAYIVRHESIPKILNLLHEVMSFTIGIDYSLILHQPNLRCFAFVPGCIKQYNNQSDIGNGVTYFENFSTLGPYWWADKMEEFNPSTHNWAEVDKMNRIEDTLNGGYNGLYAEVVTEDTYKIKDLQFVPDVVIDMGANVGVFTRYIRSMFPDCLIIAIEPNEENFKCLKHFTYADEKIIFINKAIGSGKVFHGTTAANGSGEVYLNSGLGYPEEKMIDAVSKKFGLEECSIETIMLDEIYTTYVKEGDKFIVKCDIEGNEHKVLSHQTSMGVLHEADYIAMEVHFYAMTGQEMVDVNYWIREHLKSLSTTHDCLLDGVHFWATKKS